MKIITISLIISLSLIDFQYIEESLSEKEILNIISSGLASEFGVGGDDINKLTSCFGQILRNKYPNFPKGIKKSQLKELKELVKLSTLNCIKDGRLNLTLKWTPFLERMLYEKFYNLKELESFDKRKRKNFTDCVILGLKSQNPNGFSLRNGSFNRNPVDSPVIECKDLLLN